MTDLGESFRQIAQATDPTGVETVLRRAGAVHLFWQTSCPEYLYTWDRVPQGFFSMYYGLDSDRYCAIANALRSGWVCFTFRQAREALGGTDEARDAERIWTNFDMADGLCVVQGYGSRRSLLLVSVRDGAERLLETAQPLFAAAAARLDLLLRDRLDVLYKASRKRRLLSPAEMKVVRAQIDFPRLTMGEQAQMLGISPRMLQKRHRDISKKLGVSSFHGAIVIALDRSEDRFARSDSRVGSVSVPRAVSDPS